MTTDAKPRGGLEDVVAATSAICYLDGDRGVLAYYGYDIHDLARGASFEEVCYLLWHGRLPNRAELGDLQSQLAAGRPLAESTLRLMKQLPSSDGMDTLRTLTSALGQYDPEVSDNSPQANYRKAVRLTGQIASLVATYGRLQAGRRTDSAGSRARPRGELPVHADRHASERAGDASVRRGARAARRSRAERLDVRRTRRRGHAHRPLLGHRRGDRDAEGAAPWRRERGRHAPAHRHRAGRDARAHRRGDQRAAREKGQDSWLRPSRVSHGGSARDASAADVEGSRRARRQPALVRDVAAHRADRHRREEAVSERRLLLGVHLLHARDSRGALHADFRREPDLGVDGSLPRAVPRTTG